MGAPQQIVGTAVSLIMETIFPQVLHLKNFMASSLFLRKETFLPQLA
jgi:hypothetical protein